MAEEKKMSDFAALDKRYQSSFLDIVFSIPDLLIFTSTYFYFLSFIKE